MTLVVTPGASNADCYVTLTAFDTYCDKTSRGVSGTDGEREGLLRAATAYLENAYRGRWVGIRANETQALAWPRVDGHRDIGGGFTEPLYDLDGFEIASDAIPTQIVAATCEAAIASHAGVDLQPALSANQLGIKSIAKTVGPLSKDITYRDDAPMVGRYLAIEGLLRGLVTGTPGASSGTVRLVRG